MAINFLPQAQLRLGRQELNFQPLSQGVDSVIQGNRQNAMLEARREEAEANRGLQREQMGATAAHRNALLKMQQEQMQQRAGYQNASLGMQRERFGMEKQQFQAGQEARALQKWAGLGQAVLQMPPEQRAAAWQKIFNAHPKVAERFQQYGIGPTDFDRGAQLLIAEARGYRDDASSDTKYGKSGTVFQDPATGQFFSAQFGTDGRPKVTPLAPNMVPANLSPTAAGAKAGAVEDAKGQAKARQALGGVVSFAETTLPNLRAVIESDRLDAATGWSRNLPTVRNDTAALQRRMEQLDGSRLIQGIQYLRGTGTITEVEGLAASRAVARLDAAQGAEDYRQAAREYERIISNGVRRAYESAGLPVPAEIEGMLGSGGATDARDSAERYKSKYGLE